MVRWIKFLNLFSSQGLFSESLPFWLINWIVFYVVSAMFQPYNGSDYCVKVISFEILKFPCRPSRGYSFSKSSETIFCVPRCCHFVSNFENTVLVIYKHKRVKSIVFAVSKNFCEESGLAILIYILNWITYHIIHMITYPFILQINDMFQ